MEIILGVLSVLIIAAVLFIPRAKTPHEKMVWEQDQERPYESLGCDTEEYF